MSRVISLCVFRGNVLPILAVGLSAFVPCAAVAKSVVEDAAAVPKLGLFIKSS